MREVGVHLADDAARRASSACAKPARYGLPEAALAGRGAARSTTPQLGRRAASAIARRCRRASRRRRRGCGGRLAERRSASVGAAVAQQLLDRAGLVVRGDDDPDGGIHAAAKASGVAGAAGGGAPLPLAIVGADARERRAHRPRQAARGPQRAPARGRHARRGAAADPRRRRLGKTRVLTHRIAYLLAHRAGARRTRSSRSRSRTRPRRRCASASSCCSAAHARDVGDDLPRRLRADAARRGARGSATRASSRSTTRPTRAASSSAASTSSTSTPSASRRGAIHNQISDAKNKLRDAEAYGQLVGSLLRADRRRRLRALRVASCTA